MILCGHCGGGIEPQQNFCLSCGQPVRQANPLSTESSLLAAANTDSGVAIPLTQSEVGYRRSPNRLTFVLIVAGLLATAAVSVAITVALVNRENHDEVTSTSGVSPSPTGSTSVRITARASSMRPSIGGGPYTASNVLDGSLTTAWVEGVPGPGVGEWIQLDFDREVQLLRAHITPGYFKSKRLWANNNRLAAATLQFSDGSERNVSFADRMDSQSVELSGKKSRWVRFTIDSTYGGAQDSDDTPISEISFDLTP